MKNDYFCNPIYAIVTNLRYCPRCGKQGLAFPFQIINTFPCRAPLILPSVNRRAFFNGGALYKFIFANFKNHLIKFYSLNGVLFCISFSDKYKTIIFYKAHFFNFFLHFFYFDNQLVANFVKKFFEKALKWAFFLELIFNHRKKIL